MQSYMQDLLKIKTLEEIAAQTSVTKKWLKQIINGETLQVRHEKGKRIFMLWIMEVCAK